MKVKPDHLAALRTAIEPLDTSERREQYRARQIPRAESVKDIDRRYRWDLLWASGGHRVIPLNDYLDAHLDTALRKLVNPL